MANPGPATTVTPNYIFNGDASNGVLLGGAATNLVGFHGATPVVQAGVITALSNTATGTEIATAVNAIITALKNKGLTA
jgi:hypothetical protein